MREIAGDQGSAEWESDRPASKGKTKQAWLAKAVAKMDAKNRAAKTPVKAAEGKKTAEKKTAKSKRRVAPKK